MSPETYLGDGLYARVDEHGTFWLRAPRYTGGDHFVALEPEVLKAFERFVARVRAPRMSADGGEDIPL